MASREASCPVAAASPRVQGEVPGRGGIAIASPAGVSAIGVAGGVAAEIAPTHQLERIAA